MTEDVTPKVLMVVEQLRRTVPGGVGAYGRGLLMGLDQWAEEGDEIDVTLFASRMPDQVLSKTTRATDPLTGFRRPVLLSRLPGPLLTRVWDHGWVRDPDGFDVVHSISLACPRARLKGHARHVVTVHDVAWRQHPETATARGARWHEAALRRAKDSDTALIVSSRRVATELTCDGVEAERITVVPGGSDHLVPEDSEQTDALLERLGVRGEFLLTVGTLEPRKNTDRLLRAYRLTRRALPEAWPLIIVGPTGWGPRRSDFSDQEGVVFAGAVEDAILTGLYRRARAFVYIPLSEGYGMPPLEAMRVGTPSVVANEVPSVVELDDEAGPPAALIVDPFDVDDIAAALTKILTDDLVRADLSARGEAHARARTWRAAARQHIALWKSLV